MNKDAKVYITVIGFVGLTYIVSSLTQSPRLNDFFILSLLLGGIGLAGKLVKDSKIKTRMAKFNSSSGSGINYTTNQCRDIAKDWAKSNFKGKIKSKKGLSFDWTQSNTQPAPIYDFENDEMIHVRCFYTPYGPKNKGIYVFVDATNGEHYASEPVMKHEMKDNPFEYLAAYRMTRRNPRLLASEKTDENYFGKGGISMDFEAQGVKEDDE